GVALALRRGGIALKDVDVRPGATAPSSSSDSGPPLVAWKRFAVNVAWLPLFRKTVELESVELDEPRLALDRLASGEINLMALVPKGDAPATEPVEGQAPERAPAGAEGAGAKAKAAWGVGVDYLALRGGHIRFRDFAVRGVEPVDVALPTIEVRDVALRPGIYGRPARAHLDVRVDEGRLRMNTQLRLIAHGVAVATSLRARRLPVRRTRLYVPKVGWREPPGELGAWGGHRRAGELTRSGREAVAVVGRLAARDGRPRARAGRRRPHRRRSRARGTRAERRRRRAGSGETRAPAGRRVAHRRGRTPRRPARLRGLAHARQAPAPRARCAA